MELQREKEPARSKGPFRKTSGLAAANYSVGFAAGDSHEKIETTIGDLIVALTEETHQFVHDEHETYEVVAYVLSERLSRRSHKRYFLDPLSKCPWR